MLAYVAEFYRSCGNYHSFGDIKFTPGLDRAAFVKILKSSDNYTAHQEVIDFILSTILDEVYNEESPFK